MQVNRPVLDFTRKIPESIKGLRDPIVGEGEALMNAPAVAEDPLHGFTGAFRIVSGHNGQGLHCVLWYWAALPL